MNLEQQIVKARKAGFAAFVGTTIEWYDFSRVCHGSRPGVR